MAEDVQLLENRLKLLKMEEKKVSSNLINFCRLGRKSKKLRRKHERLPKTSKDSKKCKSRRNISRNRKNKK